MYFFIVINNKLKKYTFSLDGSYLELSPIYFLQVYNSIDRCKNFFNYIFDTVVNTLKIYTTPPPLFNYFIFKHPNIKEIEEEYAKESALLFNVKLTCFKKGWGIKTTVLNETVVRDFCFRNFANPLLDIFIPFQEFKIEKITRAVVHKLELPPSSDIPLLEKFYNLSAQELNMIFKDYLHHFKRNPNIIEIGTFAQYWSEHCRHKTINGAYYIDSKLIFSNLLKETIFEVTKRLKKKWCVSVFKDNSGVIDIDGKHCICAKVETHNHPSSIEPYSGSATGIGGVIRDIIGTGRGAKPICSVDVFFVGNFSNSCQYKGILWEPRNLLKNLVLGVRDYGNRMGIPTTAGSVYFDDSYIFNPLVFCGTIGIIEKDKVRKVVEPGDLIILIGGRTGRDGLHGASFSSGKISKEELENAINSVQLPNPIVEKKIEQFILRTTSENIVKSITDCGAGGIAVASLEIIQHFGAVIKLDTVKTKYTGISPYEIWLSESQERMIVIIDRKDIRKFSKIADEEGVELSIIGKIIKEPVCKIYYKNKLIANFLKTTLDKKLPPKKFCLKSFECITPIPLDTNFCEQNHFIVNNILKIISHPIVSSKESIIRQYDHEVGGRTILKPIVAKISPSDGCLLKPFYNKNIGIGIGLGHKVELMKVDAYEGALQSVDEAVRNLISLGVNPHKIALLDNFCWGDSKDPEQLYKLCQTAQACKNIALTYETPFISGKDSFNNYFIDKQNNKINITPTLLITAIGIIEDINNMPKKIFSSSDSSIYYIGSNQFVLGGSLFYKQYGYTGRFYPKLNIKEAIKLYRTIYKAIKNHIILSIHDISDGGLITAIIEMLLDSQYGFVLEFPFYSIPEKENWQIKLIEFLFSEPPASFIVEVENKKCNKFEDFFKKFFLIKIGKVSNNNNLTIKYRSRAIVISKNILKKHYLKPLKNLFP